jgi:hypothetical protein
MNYIVRYYNGIDIINDISTNSYHTALIRETELRGIWGGDNVWIVDMIMELMVG